MSLEDIVDRLVQLNDDNLVEEVKNSNDVQWCLSELQDLLEVIGDMNGARLRELAEADKEGRVVVLPCKVGGSMLDMSYPEKPSIMKRLHFAVAYENIDGVVYHQPWGIFTENIKAGYIKPISSEEKRND